MAGKDKIPEIRFAGFNDAWEQRKLEEIADVLDGDRGNNYPNGNELQEKGHTLFLSATNVTTNGFVFDNNQYITEEKSNSMGNGKLVVDDIVLTSRGSIGHIAWYNEATQQQVPYARINSGMLILRSKDFVTPCYVTQFLKSPLGKKQIDLISFGSAQPQLTKKDVSNYIVSLPSDCTEQRKLGDFFDYFDHLITLHQRKYDKLVIVKKSMLEKMFPKDGADVPEIRFAGFTDAWERCELGDVYNFQYGQFNNNPSNGGIYPVYGANGIIGGYSNFNAEDSVVIGHMGEYAGSVLWGEGKHFVTYNGTISTPKSKEINTKYGYYMLYQLNIRKICGGSGLPFLAYDKLQKLNGVFPISVKEQIKISEFFTNLDHLITLHQRELEKLKNIKQSLLEKMFV